MSCNIARTSKRNFVRSKKLSQSAYHYDKSDPNNFKFPLRIDEIDEDTLHEVVNKMIEQYKKFDYKHLSREQLDTQKDWNDMYILLLLKFYKNGWSIEFEDEAQYVPNFVFTYSVNALKQKIDYIVSYAYDHISEDTPKHELLMQHSWSALDITHLLHYFIITHVNYKENESD